jgi:hypothetical protein
MKNRLKIDGMFCIGIFFVSFSIASVASAENAFSGECADTRTPLAANATVHMSDDGSKLVAMSPGGAVTTYTCECKGLAEPNGSCTPTLTPDEKDVACFGSCSMCERHSSSAGPVVLPELDRVRATPSRAHGNGNEPGETETSSCFDFSEAQDAELGSKIAEVESSLAAEQFSGLIHLEDNEMAAPEGWLLTVESAGGREILVPIRDGDANAPAGSAKAKPRAKCKCTTTGGCHWEGLACVSDAWPSTCSSCGIRIRIKR